MVDVRRALPAAPAAVCCGTGAMALAPPGGGAPPQLTVALGAAVAGAAGVGLYRELAAWSERGRRLLGYAAAVVVAAMVAGAFLLAALGTSLCGLFGEQCTGAELARARRDLALAPTGGVSVLAAYALLDLTTRPRR